MRDSLVMGFSRLGGQLIKAAAAALVMLFSVSAHGAASIVGTETSITYGQNCTAGSGSNRVFVITIGDRATTDVDPTITALTFGTATLANGQIISAIQRGEASSKDDRSAIFYIKEANIPAGATAVVPTWSVTMGSGGAGSISCYTLQDVDQTTPIDNTASIAPASSTNWSSSVTVAAGTVQVAAFTGLSGSITATAVGSFTEDMDIQCSASARCAHYSLTSSGGSSLTYGVTWSSASAGTGVIASFAPANAVFTVNPTVTARAADYTIGGTTGGSVEVDCVAVPKDQTAPTVAQVDAGNGTGDVAALAHTSETWNGADSMTLDMAATPPLISDLYCTDGTNLVTLVDETITPTGYQAPIALTSIGTQSSNPIKVHNDAETTDVATGDYVSWHTVTTPSSFAITMALDGNVTYTDPTASAQWANAIGYDVSAGANFSTLNPARFDFNAEPIECYGPGYVGPAVKISTNPGDVDLSTFVTEPNGYAVTYAELSGDFGNRTVNTSTGVLSGTLQADEVEAGITAVVRATSASGSTCDLTVLQFPIDTLTVPNGSGVECFTFAVTINGPYGWLTASSTYATSQTVPINYVVSQNPAAAAEVEPNTGVSFVCSLGKNPSGNSVGIGVRIGL